MKWACIDDFSVRDIRDPQPQRIKRLLSALVNFYLFAEDQRPHLQTLEEKAEAIARAEHEQERTVVELDDQVRRKREEIEARAPRVAELEAANDQTRSHLLERKAEAKTLSERIERDKHERDVLKERAETLALQINQHDAEILRLRSRVVQSPARVKQTLHDLANNLGSMKADIAELESKKVAHDAKLAVLRRYAAELQTVIKTLDEWESERVKAVKEQERLQRLSDDRDARNNEIKELELRTQVRCLVLVVRLCCARPVACGS